MSFDFETSTLHIQVAKRCNLKCTMCSWESWHTNTGMMEWDVFIKTIQDAETAGIKSIVFGNAQGEPFLNPQIFEMISYVKDRGFWLMASTNGTPFTKKRIQALAKSGIDNLQFSFAGFDQKSYEAIYVGGRWDQVSRNLKDIAFALNQENATTTLTINGCIASEILDTYSPMEYSQKTRNFLYSIGITPDKHNINIQLPHNFAGEKKTDLYLDGAMEGSFYNQAENTPPCFILNSSPGVYSDGKMTACGCLDPNGEMLIGDITTTSLQDVMSGQSYKKIKHSYETQQFDALPLCKDCDYPFIQRTIDPISEWWRGDYNVTTLGSTPYKPSLPLSLSNQPKITKSQIQELLSDEHSVNPVRFLLGELKSARVSFNTILQNTLQKPIECLHIGPCTDFVRENIDWFTTAAPQIKLYDKNLCGQLIGPYLVQDIESINYKLEPEEYLLITTDNVAVQRHYKKHWPSLNILQSKKLQHSLRSYEYSKNDITRIQALNDLLKNNLKKHILITSQFDENYFKILDEHGIDISDVILLSRYPQHSNRIQNLYDRHSIIPLNMLLSWQEFIASFALQSPNPILLDKNSFINSAKKTEMSALDDTLQELINQSTSTIITLS